MSKAAGSPLARGASNPPLPLILDASSEGATELRPWLQSRAGWLKGQLLEHGAVLLRGFATDPVRSTELAGASLCDAPMDYTDRVTRRSPVRGPVVTATDTPASYAINLHCENTFAASFPRRLFLACVRPPVTGGRTPLADVRRVHQRLDPELRQRFAERGVRYVCNFGRGLGMDWREAFQCRSRDELEVRAKAAGIDLEWLGQDRLRTAQTRPAMSRHPETGEWCWFNHAMTLSVRFMHPGLREVLLRQFAPEDLPHATCYGDGRPIEDDTLDAVWEAYAAETRTFEWRAGDLILIENLLVAHGREPYTGDRQVVALLGDSTDWSGIEHSAVAERAPRVAEPAARSAPAPDGGSPERQLEVEVALTTAVAAVLELESVTLDDDFIAIGGDSVGAARVLARVYAETGYEIMLADFLDVERLGAVLDVPEPG